MSAKPRFLVFGGAALFFLLGTALAGDLHLTLPKHSQPTPVQKLNREGVRAVEKHDYGKAKALFYKAYLLDPNDPFTLNNLGYIAELEGEVERAQRFYALASEQASDALVDQATSKSVIGKPLNTVAGRAPDERMKVNQINVAAIALLLKDRAPEADVLLQRALALNSRDPFTLNNLGYAEEKEGEWEKALSFYQRAANIRSNDAVVVTINPKWRGKAISEVARQNAENLRKLMTSQETASVRVARLNLRGVSALNRNDRRSAREDFESAYKLDPNDAFTLNNMGYLSEMDGDRETANYFYERAEAARKAGRRVDVATRRDAEGRKLGEVAERSNSDVSAKMQAELDVKRRQGGPIVLKRRDQSPVTEVTPPAAPAGNQVTPPAVPPDVQPPAQQPLR
jgi:Flp pilus assembly protein TadD